MHTKAIAILGVPLSCLSKEKAVALMLSILERNSQTKNSSFVHFVSMDILIDSTRWGFDEINSIERKRLLYQPMLSLGSDALFSAVSKLLGNPWQSQFNEEELLFSLLKVLDQKKNKLFFLGTDENKSQASLKEISTLFPDITLVGSTHTRIPIRGDLLESAEAHDELILDEIHKQNPEILLLDLGQLYQSIWFDRVRNRLHVPLVFGIGFQKAFKISNDNLSTQGDAIKNVFDRYIKKPLITFYKLFFLLVPLIIYQFVNRWIIKPFYTYWTTRVLPKNILRSNILFFSEQKSLVVVVLPTSLDRLNCQKYKQMMEESLDKDLVVLDCAALRFLDLEGIQWLVDLISGHNKRKCRVLGLGIHPNVHLLLDLNSAWDLIYSSCYHTSKDIEHVLQDQRLPTLYDSVYQDAEETIISFFGGFYSYYDYEKLFDKYSSLINDKNCLLNLAYCTEVSNGGIAFFLRLLSFQTNQHKTLTFFGVSSELKRELRLADVDKSFSMKI